MASAAVRHLERPLRRGIVLTKYGHIMGEIPGVICREAGHPVPDEGSFRGAREILEMTRGLRAEDMVLFKSTAAGRVEGLANGRSVPFPPVFVHSPI